MRKTKPIIPKKTKNPHVKYIMILVLTTVKKAIKKFPIRPKIANPKTIP